MMASEAMSQAELSFSQSGEDRIMFAFFQMIGSPLGLKYIDVGAAYPAGHNNTFLFYLHGGNGLLVEADPSYAEHYRTVRPRDAAEIVAVVPQRLRGAGSVEFYAMQDRGWSTVSASHVEVARRLNKGDVREKLIVPCVTINELLQKHSGLGDIDLLSIDIEGVDREVLAELDTARFRPKAIVAENDGGRPVHEGIMQQKGYHTFAFTHINTIYVDSSVFPA